MITALRDIKFRFSFRITVIGIFLFMTSLTAAVAIGLQYYFSTMLATETTREAYRQAASSTRDHLAAVDSRAVDATRMLASYRGLVARGRIATQAREVFAKTLQDNPLFYAIYIGLASGDFFELVNLDTSSVVRSQLQALPQDRWVTITVSGNGRHRVREFSYYDEQFHFRTSRKAFSDYQPGSRPWFIHAELGKVNKTAPYLFQHLQAPGQTYSMRIAGKDAVLAVDIALSSLSEKLSQNVISGDSQIFLYQKTGEIIASSEHSQPALAIPKARPLVLNKHQQQLIARNPVLTVSNETDWPPFDFVVSGEPRGYAIDVLSLVGQMTGLQFNYVNGYSWPELLALYRQGRLDILQPVLDTKTNAGLGEMSRPIVTAPFGVLTKKGDAPVTDIQQLAGKRVAIPKGWSIIETLRLHFPAITVIEVDGVKGMFDAVRQGRADAGLDTAAILNYTARQFFLDDVEVHAPLDFGTVSVPTGLHYIVQPARRGIAQIIDLALANITEQQRQALNARWLLSSDSPRQQNGTVPYPQLVTLARDPSRFDSMQRTTLGGKTYFVYLQAIGDGTRANDYFAVVTPVASVLAPAIGRVKISLLITGGCLLLLLPVSSWFASFIVQPVKQLALENEKVQQRRYRALLPLRSRIVEIDQLATSLKAMAHAIEKHVKEQEALMEAFIQLIAQAIDDKSHHTAGHCARVPELALLLAEKAEQSDQPPFDEFRFDGEGEWREFRIGAWLHDCGKITTPEYIVDKGTKLETVYNRIHEIRMRFEVLWRDTEIEYWQKHCESPEQDAAHREALETRQQALQEAFAFIATCNQGSESMGEEDVARLEQLAQMTWKRHFDDSLGLSQVELTRYTGDSRPLPVTEKLLADKPWHIIERTHGIDYDSRLGIRMDVPEHLYNLGELYNLSISRGTLTAEDRFKINEHVISTIKMLDSLPLPQELERVPRYATTHHETLDGQGYPRQLTADDLSIPERIMVLADIFEALTASDRPYKVAQPVSVAIDILHGMVQDNHVDKDVFELFLTSGAYLEYARRYLPPEQVDEVDVAHYLG